MNKLITKELLNNFLQLGKGNDEVLETELSDVLTYNTYLYKGINVFVDSIEFLEKIVIINSCDGSLISDDREFECIALTFNQFISMCLQ